MAIPLTANRLTLTFLGSAESVAIPEMLRVYGYTTEGSLAVYGVLTGMALPLIFFPNALTGSIAVMLLPMISENYCQQNMTAVRSLTFRTLKYCLAMGIVCLTGFVLLGPWFGEVMFHSALAGRCIRTLGWICPFLYLDVTLSSILQGLGKAGTIFGINILSLSPRLCLPCNSLVWHPRLPLGNARRTTAIDSNVWHLSLSIFPETLYESIIGNIAWRLGSFLATQEEPQVFLRFSFFPYCMFTLLEHGF